SSPRSLPVASNDRASTLASPNSSPSSGGTLRGIWTAVLGRRRYLQPSSDIFESYHRYRLQNKTPHEGAFCFSGGEGVRQSSVRSRPKPSPLTLHYPLF